MANLKAKYVTYTTVAVILVLDVRIYGQLKTILRQQKLVSHNFHRTLEKQFHVSVFIKSVKLHGS